MLYILGGLPATGKTELSKFLASSLGAVHIRIDTIEQELKTVVLTSYMTKVTR
jgi:predicted kinase